MEIKQIEYVLEVARAGSMSGAAENLFLSQPNLSYAIRNLEKELGHDIFLRTNRGIELTEFGRQFLQYAQPLVQQFEYLQTISREILPSGRVAFSVSASPLRFVNKVFIDLYKAHAEDNVLLRYKEDTLDNILQDVDSRQADMGVLIFSSFWKKSLLKLAAIKGMQYEQLSSEAPHVIVRDGHILARSKLDYVTVDMLESFQYVTSNLGSFGAAPNEFAASPIARAMENSRLVVYNRACLYDILYSTDAFSISSNNLQAYGGSLAYEGITAIPLLHPGFELEIGWIQRNDCVAQPIHMEFLRRLKATLTE